MTIKDISRTEATSLSPLQVCQSISLRDIEQARQALAGTVLRTPLLRHQQADWDWEISLKPESLQPYGSFKVRCATYAVQSSSTSQLRDGIITASAGNFGQGLAAAARARGVRVQIYAPDSAARTKIAAMRALDAEVIEVPFSEWWEIVNGTLPQSTGHFIHPCSGRSVLLGNATIAAEILEDDPDTDAIYVPFGGGGLALGIAVAAKLLKPGIKVIACEAEGLNPLTQAFEAGHPIEITNQRKHFIDGIGSTMVLASMWPAIKAYIDGVVTVSADQTAAALRALFKENRLVAEGAGAVPVASAIQPEAVGNRRSAIVSGGNIDAAVFARLIDADDTPGRTAAATDQRGR